MESASFGLRNKCIRTQAKLDPISCNIYLFGKVFLLQCMTNVYNDIVHCIEFIFIFLYFAINEDNYCSSQIFQFYRDKCKSTAKNKILNG